MDKERNIVTGTGVWVYPDACPNDYDTGEATRLVNLINEPSEWQSAGLILRVTKVDN
jgi:hypothetical protein